MSIFKNQLIDISKTYCEARGLSPSHVSKMVFNDGKLIGNMERGADITTGRCERAILWFSANWPADTEWPEGIARPTPIGAVAS